ncbi:hypothetical protein ABPG72_000413 [Tetrahymena utriculariae]
MGNSQQQKKQLKEESFSSIQKFKRSSVQSHTNILLYLQHCSIDDSSAQILSYSLANCINLQILKLYVCWNNFGLQGIIHIGTALGSCTNLRSLLLSLIGLKIGDQGVINLICALKNCPNIQYLVFELLGNFKLLF